MLGLTFALALAAVCSAAVDQQTFDNMVYSAHFAADAYPMPNCSYPEGTKKLQVYMTGAKGFLAVDGLRKWIVVRRSLRTFPVQHMSTSDTSSSCLFEEHVRQPRAPCLAMRYLTL